MNKWLIGGTVVTGLLVGTGLKKISDVVKKEELAAPPEAQTEIVKENITVSSVLINRKGVTNWLATLDLDVPKNNKVVVCSAYGCAHKTPFKVSNDLLNDVKGILDASTSGEEERANLKTAIDTMKVRAGDKTGTADDKPGEPFMGNGNPGQMSQLDETMNTLQYLYILADGGYIRFHHLEKPSTAKYFIGSVNVIVDKDTGKAYGVGYDKEGKSSIVER